MQMIAAIVGRQQPIGMVRIGHDAVKIDDCVEVSRRANPLVHGPPVGLAQCSGMVVVGPYIRRDRPSNHPQPMRMGARDDLFVDGDYPLHEHRMFGR
jgi:hypothetical protein